MTSAQHSERWPVRDRTEYVSLVADLKWQARANDYYAKVSERFGKPERFYSDEG